MKTDSSLFMFPCLPSPLMFYESAHLLNSQCSHLAPNNSVSLTGEWLDNRKYDELPLFACRLDEVRMIIAFPRHYFSFFFSLKKKAII